MGYYGRQWEMTVNLWNILDFSDFYRFFRRYDFRKNNWLGIAVKDAYERFPILSEKMKVIFAAHILFLFLFCLDCRSQESAACADSRDIHLGLSPGYFRVTRDLGMVWRAVARRENFAAISIGWWLLENGLWDRKCQTAYKPGSVPSGRYGQAIDSRSWITIHLGRPLPDASRDLPEERRGKPPGPVARPTSSYMVLLPVGFVLPPPSPVARCALTAPFHPYPGFRRTQAVRSRWRYVFCDTFPGIAPAGRYPAPSFHGARTFLSPGRCRPEERPSSRLTL